MAVDTVVKDIEEIRKPREIDDILRRIKTYEQERQCRAGVILLQRRQLRGTYKIVSEEEAHRYLSSPVQNQPRTCEWGVKFYTTEDLEKLRNQLKYAPSKN